MATRSKPYCDLSRTEKARAISRSIANVYQSRGLLTPEPCQYCGELAQKHHSDYSQPLKVIWLCEDHHRELHVTARACAQAELSSWARAFNREHFANVPRETIPYHGNYLSTAKG